MHETDKAIQRPRLRLNVFPHARRTVRLCYFGIGERFNHLHDNGLTLGILQRFKIEQFTALGRLINGVAHPQPEQAVACRQMMVNEA